MTRAKPDFALLSGNRPSTCQKQKIAPSVRNKLSKHPKRSNSVKPTPLRVTVSNSSLTFEGDWLPHMRNFQKRIYDENEKFSTASSSGSVDFTSDNPFQDAINVATAQKYGFDMDQYGHHNSSQDLDSILEDHIQLQTNTLANSESKVPQISKSIANTPLNNKGQILDLDQIGEAENYKTVLNQLQSTMKGLNPTILMKMFTQSHPSSKEEPVLFLKRVARIITSWILHRYQVRELCLQHLITPEQMKTALLILLLSLTVPLMMICFGMISLLK